MAIPVLAGAEPIDLAGGPVGALLCHGFTGTTASMRPWAEHLAAAGLTVRAPRLPGHGTRWQELNTTQFSDWYGELERSFDDLLARCETVFVMGLSMGGTLSLRLAELRDEVAGLVLVNTSLTTERKQAQLLPLLSRVPGLLTLVPSSPAIGSDIKKEGEKELAYERTPHRAFASLQKAWPVVCADLHRITCPVLVYRSRVDHVVEPISGRMLLEGINRTRPTAAVTERILENSYHVATQDNDAPEIFAGSLDFVRAHAPAAAG